MGRARDRRRLEDASVGSRPEWDAEGSRWRREQARDQRPARHGDRQQQRSDQALLPTHVHPLSRRQHPQGTIGREGVSLERKGRQLSSFKLKLVAYFVLLSLVP